MRYWFTTHWPRLVTDPAGPQAGVWVPDDKLHVINDMAPGDLVWIYEAASGPPPLDIDGMPIRRLPGRGGVVALVEVTEYPQKRAGTTPEQYKGRSPIWWLYHAGTRPVNTAGFLSRADALTILGYNPTWSMHGFGSKSGIKEITEAAHEQLREAFTRASHRELKDRLSRPTQVPRGPGGEQEPHRRLKERIAADPAGVLGEAGLIHQQTEKPFPTGDRIDIVLEDRYGRPVAVEVELDCGHLELCGPLQCMKYRGLLAYELDRELPEVRMILAAHSVHPDVKTRCERFEIQVIEIRR